LRLKVETPAVPPKASYDPHEIVHTALCAEVRDGVLCIFLPPVPLLEDFVTLLEAVEATAADLKLPVRLEGYTPPSDPRLKEFRITPDPGVIEVNIHPPPAGSNWWTTPRAVRGSAPDALGHREVHARRPPHRHRRRQPHHAGRQRRRPTRPACAGRTC
jgi:hypothetical protein